MATKINRFNAGDHLFEYQLALLGKTSMDVIDDDRWRFNFTLTTREYRLYKKYAVALIRKVFKCNRGKAENTFNWFFATFGVRIINK